MIKNQCPYHPFSILKIHLAINSFWLASATNGNNSDLVQTAVTFCRFIVTELQIYQNLTKRPVLQNFSTRIIQRPRHYLWTSWSIFTPTLPILLLYDWIFPIHRGRVIRIANPCSLFHTFYIFFHHRNLSRRIASDPTFMEISNMLNILQSLFFLLPLSEILKLWRRGKSGFYFYSVNIWYWKQTSEVDGKRNAYQGSNHGLSGLLDYIHPFVVL